MRLCGSYLVLFLLNVALVRLLGSPVIVKRDSLESLLEFQRLSFAWLHCMLFWTPLRIIGATRVLLRLYRDFRCLWWGILECFGTPLCLHRVILRHNEGLRGFGSSTLGHHEISLGLYGALIGVTVNFKTSSGTSGSFNEAFSGHIGDNLWFIESM